MVKYNSYGIVIGRKCPNARRCHDSSQGDFHEKLASRFDAFKVNHKSGVIILGKDTAESLAELIVVKDHITSKGYSAGLIKQFPDIPSMSNSQKVSMWTISSRFCIMVDREPSGHIKEYDILTKQQTILAVLQPKIGGSSFMITDDEVDINFIKNRRSAISTVGQFSSRQDTGPNYKCSGRSYNGIVW